VPLVPAPLRHRAFRAVWTGSAVSNVGTWMQTFALGYYVADLTEQAAWSGAIAAAEFLPTAVLGPVGGALADRYSRRGLLLVTNLAQGVLAAILTVLVAAGEPGAPLVALFALLSGSIWALGFPAFQAILPELVPQEHLTGAIGLSSAQWNLGRVIGPAIGGAVYTIAGIEWALAVNAASYLAIVAALATVAIPRPQPSGGVGILRSIGDAWRHVRAEPGLRAVVAGYGILGLLLGPFIGLIPAFVVTVLDAGPGASAAMITAQGLGAIVTGVAMGAVSSRFGLDAVLVGAFTLLPLALVAYAASPGVGAAVATIFAVGLLYFAVLTSLTSITQFRAPAALRGRVLAINNVVLGLSYPLGLLLQGAVGDRIGLRTTTAGFAVVALVVVVALRTTRPDLRAVLRPFPATAPGVG
jgi:predicted MFS family arabinose efflux permease